MVDDGEDERIGGRLPEDTLQVALGSECDAFYASYFLWPRILQYRIGERKRRVNRYGGRTLTLVVLALKESMREDASGMRGASDGESEGEREEEGRRDMVQTETGLYSRAK
jgi:hypothetical protein